MPTPTPTPAAPIGAPISLVAKVTGAAVQLSWKSGWGLAAYEVQRAAGKAAWATLTSVPISNPPPKTQVTITYTDATVAAGTTYNYRVRSTRPDTASAFCNTATATLPAAVTTAKPTNQTTSVPPPTPPVVVTPMPTVTPVPSSPVSTPTTGIKCGSPGVVTTAYHAGQCPVAVLLDVSGSTSTRGDRRQWHLPGATVVTDPNTGQPATDGSLVGQAVTAVYDQPGNHPGSCTVTHADGSIITLSVAITVDPETRPVWYVDAAAGSDGNVGTSATAAWKTAAKIAAAAQAACRIVTVGPLGLPTSTTLPASIVLGKPGIVFDGIPNAAGQAATWTCNKLPAISVSAGASVLVRGITFNSDGTLGVNADGTPSSWQRPMALQNNGTDATLINCTFGRLSMGVQSDAGDLSVIGCKSTDATTMGGQIVYACNNAARLVADYNDLPGCTTEADIRTGTKVTVVSVERNKLNQAAGLLKAPIDIRSCNGAVIASNDVANGQISFSNNSSEPTSVVTDALVTGNTFRGSIPSILKDLSEWIVTKDRASGILIEKTNVVTPLSRLISANAGVTDVVQDGVTLVH